MARRTVLSVFLSAIFGAMLLFSTSSVALADTITFSSLEQAGTSLINTSDPYVEGAYRILNSGQLYFAQQSNYSYAGSAGLHERIANGLITLNRTDGGSFNLTSIDLSVLIPGGASPAVVFTGFLAGGGTVTQSFTPTSFGFQTFVFNSSFVNLTSVRWNQGTDEAHAHQFDNIVVASSVPEPATMMLLGSGLVGVAAKLRRMRREKI